MFKVQHVEKAPEEMANELDPAGQVGAEFLQVSTQVCEGVGIRYWYLCEINIIYWLDISLSCAHRLPQLF